MNIGQKVRKIRELKNFTQEFMAEKLNISQQAYSMLEKEDSVPFNRLQQISETLQIPIEHIIKYDDQFIFNNNGEKAINNNIQYHYSDKIEKIYEDQIELLKEKIKYLENSINLKDLELIELKKQITSK